jgi:hypothetical protein
MSVFVSPYVHYLGPLRRRMNSRGFPHTDELLRAATRLTARPATFRSRCIICPPKAESGEPQGRRSKAVHSPLGRDSSSARMTA